MVLEFEEASLTQDSTAKVCHRVGLGAGREGYVPQGRCSASLTLLGQVAYLIGGAYGEPVTVEEGDEDAGGVIFRHFNTVDALTLTALSHGWNRIEITPQDAESPPFPPRRGHTATAWQEEGSPDRIIVFGGVGDLGLMNDTWVLDVEKREWSRPQLYGPNPPGMRGHLAALSPSRHLVITGGDQAGDQLSANMMIFVLDLESWFWASLVAAFHGADPVAYYLRSSLAFCPFTQVGPTKDLLVYDGNLHRMSLGATPRFEWATTMYQDGHGPRPLTRFCPASALLGEGTILVFGGSRPHPLDTTDEDSPTTPAIPTSNELDDAYLLQLSESGPPTWTCLHSKGGGVMGQVSGQLPSPRNAACATAYGLHAFIFGGGQFGAQYYNDLHVMTFLPEHPLPTAPPPPHELILLRDTHGGEAAIGSLVTLVAGEGGGSREWQLVRAQAGHISPVFEAWLCGQFEEGKEDLVRLPTMFSVGTWSIFFGYATTGRLDGSGLGGEDVVELLQLADMFELSHLRQVCEVALLPSIDDDQVIDLLALSQSFSCPILKEHCLYYIQRQAWTTTTPPPEQEGGGGGGGVAHGVEYYLKTPLVSKWWEGCDRPELRQMIKAVVDPMSISRSMAKDAKHLTRDLVLA